MAILDKIHTIVGDKSAQDNKASSLDNPNALQMVADDKEAGHAPVKEIFSGDGDRPAEDAQAGVKKIEAVTLAWSRGSMYTALVLYASILNACTHHHDSAD